MSSLKSFKLSQLAETLGAELEGDPTKEIFGIGPLVSSTSDEISFISKESYRPNLELTKAGAVICNSETSKFFEGNKLTPIGSKIARLIDAGIFTHHRTF